VAIIDSWLFWGLPTNVRQVTSIRTLEKQIGRRGRAEKLAGGLPCGSPQFRRIAANASVRIVSVSSSGTALSNVLISPVKLYAEELA
jgi:hypothetical protein